MSFSNIIEGVSIKTSSISSTPQMNSNNRALSAFFLELNEEEKSKQCKLPSFNPKSHIIKQDSHDTQQQMFNDLYQRIQVRNHLKKSSLIQQQSSPHNSYQSIELKRSISPKQTLASLQSLCQTLIDSESTLSSINNINNTGKYQGRNILSSSSSQDSQRIKSKSKRGHLTNILKVIQNQKSHHTRSESENCQSERPHCSQLKKPKLNLQIKSLNLQNKCDPTNQQISMQSPLRQSIFFYNKLQPISSNSGNKKQYQQQFDLLEDRKSFNVFYDNNEDFMSSKYGSFQNRFEQLKQTSSSSKQEIKNKDSSDNKNSNHNQNYININNNIYKSSPSKTFSSPTKKRSIIIPKDSLQNQNSDKSSNTIHISDSQVESIFQTNPEIISTPQPKSQTNNIHEFNKSEENIKFTPVVCENEKSYSENKQQQQQKEIKHKIKIILRNKNHNNNNTLKTNSSEVVMIQGTTNNQIQENKILQKEIYPQKNQLFQIKKFNMNSSFVKQNNPNNESDNEEQPQGDKNQVFYSSTRYLEGRKQFIFSNTLLHRSPYKFENDCSQSNSFYEQNV